jgi:high-affinity iron transporter
MLATLVIVFREVIEAGLIVGIVLAATKGVHKRSLWVIYGVVAGLLGACVVAACAGSISDAMQGMGQELFNASILILAVLMLTWHNVWMARHGREIAMEMKSVGEAVAHGRRPLMALAIVVGIAVLREGSEIVLFLYGIAISGGDSISMMALGGLLGLLSGAALGFLTYRGLLRIPNRYLFAVTGWLIALLAAGMATQAVAFLEQAGTITAFSNIVWDSSAFLSEGSILGKTLHTLIGYNAQPTLMQLITYIATLTIIFILMRLFGHSTAHAKPAVAATMH